MGAPRLRRSSYNQNLYQHNAKQEKYNNPYKSTIVKKNMNEDRKRVSSYVGTSQSINYGLAELDKMEYWSFFSEMGIWVLVFFPPKLVPS